MNEIDLVENILAFWKEKRNIHSFWHFEDFEVCACALLTENYKPGFVGIGIGEQRFLIVLAF